MAGGVPHTLGVPLPPHVCPAGHAVPQLIVPPQPSAIGPQFTCKLAQERLGKQWDTPSLPSPASPFPFPSPCAPSLLSASSEPSPWSASTPFEPSVPRPSVPFVPSELPSPFPGPPWLQRTVRNAKAPSTRSARTLDMLTSPCIRPSCAVWVNRFRAQPRVAMERTPPSVDGGSVAPPCASPRSTSSPGASVIYGRLRSLVVR